MGFIRISEVKRVTVNPLYVVIKYPGIKHNGRRYHQGTYVRMPYCDARQWIAAEAISEDLSFFKGRVYNPAIGRYSKMGKLIRQ